MVNKILINILIIAIALTTLVACKSKGAIKLEIAEGSFKQTYDLDEELDLAKAKMRVWYSASSSIEIAINRAMISGFDSHITGESKKMLISYDGATTEVAYNVFSDIDVDTPFRLSAESTSDDKIIIKTKNVERVSEGVWATSFTMYLSGVKFISGDSLAGSGFDIQCTYSDDILKVVLYSLGEYKVTSSGSLIQLNVEKFANTTIHRVSITNIKMSNGISDYQKIPDATINI
ncbi:MAG: hypothetical protein LBE09_07560 [Christensenellaceae bacterium]|jgi:hypothetical protein|nr:hypothetical protein [Christensenellaceae bacterium]